MTYAQRIRKLVSKQAIDGATVDIKQAVDIDAKAKESKE